MTDAPERIWADGDETGLENFWDWSWARGSWNRTKEGVGEVEYVRRDLVEAIEAENQRLREALFPFADAADHAIKSVGKATTLGVLGAIAPYFVTWRDFSRARTALHSTEASNDD